MNVDEFCAFVRELKSDKGYVLACLLDLSPVDVQVFEFLDNSPTRSGTVLEVTKALNRDRSTVQRSLQKLVSLEVAQRVKVPGRGRGFKYEYRLIPMNLIKSKLINIVNDWNDTLLKTIDEVM